VLQQRADTAENKAVEAEDQIEALRDRVDDLESGLEVEKTAGQATLDEVRGVLRAEQAAIAEARAATDKANEVVEQLRSRLVELEGRQRETDAARAGRCRAGEAWPT
jgi:predicted  nucleic acid-binding Zn-ribbon protein